MRAQSITKIVGMVGTVLLCAAVACAQPASSESEHESHHPVGPSSTAPGQGMGMMSGQGMMGGKETMAMPMMPCCPCGMMMGTGMMMGGGKDSGTAAKMMEMHAEMMKANAAIMEKYANEMGAQK